MHVLFQKYLEKSRFEMAHGEVEAALRSVDSARHLAPWEEDVIRCRVSILRCLGRWQEAFHYLLACLQGLESPEAFLALERLSGLSAIAATLPPSRAAYEQASSLPPDEVAVWNPWLRLEMAEILVNGLRQPEAALRLVDSLLQPGGEDGLSAAALPLAPPEEASEGLDWRRLLRIEAEALIDLDRLEEAIHSLRRLWQAYPMDRQIRSLLGWAYLQTNAYKEAIFLFSKILYQDEKDADAHYYLGVAYEAIGVEAPAQRAFLAAYHLDRLIPPRLRLTQAEIHQIALEAISDILETTGLSIEIQWHDLPSPDGGRLRFDPRRLGSLLLQTSKAEASWRDLRFSLCLYRWNLERLCFSPEEIRQEIRLLAHEEIARLPLRSSAAANEF